MKINFLTSCLDLSGGMKIVFEYANRLAERGHEVRVVYPSYFPDQPWSGRKWYKRKVSLGGIARLFKRQVSPLKVGWFDLKAELVKVPVLSEQFVPDADISVTTFWEVAYWSCRHSRKKGEKFYFIQHYEIWAGGPRDKVEKAYGLGLGNIVISQWLKTIVESAGGKVEALIPNGIDLREFYPESGSRAGELRVLMPYRLAEWKGVRDGLEAFRIAKEKYPGIRLVMFGPVPAPGELPAHTEFHTLPVGGALRDIYNSCDMFVFPSHVEGFGLPPFEAMACRKPVVTTDVGAVPDFLTHGKTAMICGSRDVRGMAGHIVELIENKSLRDKIACGGFQVAQKMSWEKAVDSMESLFIKRALKNEAR